MPLITLFSAPKPFTDPHIATIQRNAIKSWTLLPDVEVLLLGEEQGLAQSARELGVKHLPNVSRNENGTPLISSMLDLARENSSSDMLCIINADMILMTDFLQAAMECRSKLLQKKLENFVLLSQRRDLDVTQLIEFDESWESRLRTQVETKGRLHKPSGSDFFLFPASSYPDIPGFTIGRAGWDNWMIYKARQENWPVIDCTPSIMIIHQNHDYRHLPEAKPHYDHPDSNENIRLAGGQAPIRYSVLDSTHRLIDGKLARPLMSGARFLRGVELLLRRLFFFLPEDMIENVARPKRWMKRFQRLFK